MSALRTTDLVAGLERFADRYQAIDVYAADVVELQASSEGWSVPHDWQPLGQNRFALSVAANSYVAELKPEIGVLRLQRAGGDASSNKLVGALAGAAIGSLLSKKPEAVLGGAIVGLLFASSKSDVKRVFTMRFDESGQWRAYSGPLIPVMKESLGLSG